MAKRGSQKGLELRRGELARRHGKIGVLDRAQSGDMAVDRARCRAGRRTPCPPSRSPARGRSSRRCRASPQSRRCSPRSQRSPNRVTGAAAASICGSSSSWSRPPPSRRTSISPISKPLISSSICGASSRISENSSASASRSHAESSVIRLSASRSARSSASDRSVRLTAGTSLRPSCRAASTSPQPATTRCSAVDQDRQDKAEPIEAGRELAHLLRRVLAGLAPQGLAALRPGQAGDSNHAKRG